MVTPISAVVTAAYTISKARWVRVTNQHASAAATVNGASLAAGTAFELPLLPPGEYYSDIAADGTSSSLFITAITGHHEGGVTADA